MMMQDIYTFFKDLKYWIPGSLNGIVLPGQADMLPNGKNSLMDYGIISFNRFEQLQNEKYIKNIIYTYI